MSKIIHVLFLSLWLVVPASAEESSPPLQMCVTPNWVPFEFLDKQGKYNGIIADFSHVIARKSGLHFLPHVTQDYKQSRQSLRDGKCDIIMSAVKNPKNSQEFLITKPYLNIPRAFATHIDTPFVFDFAKLLTRNRHVGIIKGAPAKITLQKKYPTARIIEFDTIPQALKALSTKTIIAFVNILPALAYHIQSNGFNNLKIGGYFKHDIPLSMFINKKHPKLLPILNDAIDTITEKERVTILSKWVQIKTGISYTAFRQIVLAISGLVLLVLIILYGYRRSNRRLKNLLNASMEGVLLLREHRIIQANAPAASLLGYAKAEELHGKPIELFSPNPLAETGLLKSVTMQTREGDPFPAQVKITYLEKGGETQIMSIMDLSELKQAESQLRSLNATLHERVTEEVEKNKKNQLLMLQQNRLAQMGEMINMIAHQWKQPLNTLSLLHASLKMKYQRSKLDQDGMDYFHENAQRQITQMSDTINDFRDFFRPQEEARIFALNDVLARSLHFIQPVLDKEQISVVLHDAPVMHTRGFPNEFGQAIINILNNAKDALIERKIEAKEIVLSLHSDESHIVLTIEDNAGGIPEAIIGQIFDPYFSTKSERNGTGLGLYMSHVIIQKHNHGKIRVENGERGARFTITIPRTDQNR